MKQIISKINNYSYISQHIHYKNTYLNGTKTAKTYTVHQTDDLTRINCGRMLSQIHKNEEARNTSCYIT